MRPDKITVGAIALALLCPPVRGQQGSSHPAAIDYDGPVEAARVAFEAAVDRGVKARADTVDKAVANYTQALKEAARAAMSGKGDPDEAKRIAAAVDRVAAALTARAADAYGDDGSDPPRGNDAKAARRKFDAARATATADAVRLVTPAAKRYLDAAKSADKAALAAADSTAATRVAARLTVTQAATTPEALTTAVEATDLLAGVKLPDAGVSGTWSATPAGLHGEPASVAAVRLGRMPIGEYDYTVRFRRVSAPTTAGATAAVALVAGFAGHRFAVTVEGPGDGGAVTCGFGEIAGTAAARRTTTGVASPGQPVTVVLHVRRDGAAVEANGVEVARIQGGYDTLTLDPARDVGDGTLGVAATNASVTVEAATLATVRPASPPPSRQPPRVVVAPPAAPAKPAPVDRSPLALRKALTDAVAASATRHKVFFEDHTSTKKLYDRLKTKSADLVTADGRVQPDVARAIYLLVNQEFETNLNSNFRPKAETVADHAAAVKAIWADLHAFKRAVAEISGVVDPKPGT